MDRKLLPRIDKTQQRISSLKKRLRSAQDKGASPRALQKARRILHNLERSAATQREELNDLKAKIVHYGRMGTSHFQFMGFFHHQYSKSLQPFLRKDGRLPTDEAEKLMMEALSHAKAAVKNNTNPESSYSHLAVMHYWSIRFCSHDPKGMTRRRCERQRFEKAKKALEGSMSHDPYYYDTHRMMAFMLTKDGDLDGAIKEIKIAKKIIKNRLRKFPTVAQVDKMIKKQLLIEGVRLARKRSYEDALAAYREALDRYGEPMPEAHHLKGVVYMRQKDYAAAEKSLKRSIKQNRRYFDARVDLAKLRFMQKRFEEGYRIIRKLLTPRVKSPDALLVRAWALESQGDIQGAIADLRRFLNVSPNSRKAVKVRRKLKKLTTRKR